MSTYWIKIKLERVVCYNSLSKQLRNKLLIHLYFLKLRCNGFKVLRHEMRMYWIIVSY